MNAYNSIHTNTSNLRFWRMTAWDYPWFFEIRPTSNGCNFVTTEPISMFLVSRMSSSSWKARKWHLQPDILSSSHPSGSKREADFHKNPKSGIWLTRTTPRLIIESLHLFSTQPAAGEFFLRFFGLKNEEKNVQNLTHFLKIQVYPTQFFTPK